MIWGFIKSDGSRVLVRCSNYMNSTEYISLLQNELIPNYYSDEIFQQDGAPCHRSKQSITFLEENAINYICDWPAQSPDLNVIENMWSYVKQKLYLTEFNNINELWMNFKKEFFEVPNDYIRNLYASFKTRINAVLAANGGITKY